MPLIVFVVLLTLAQAGAPPQIDGHIGAEEWTGATKHTLTGGGELSLLTLGDSLYVGLRGPKAGLASLCIASGDRVRILHASAALGEGIFVRKGPTWSKATDFTWALRDSPRSGGPSASERTAFLQKAGWLANASASGSPEREFQIQLAGVEAIAVTFLATDDSLALSYWPPSVGDDCRTVKVPQGFLPDTATFRPDSWHPIGHR
jgi:hypothetical protein